MNQRIILYIAAAAMLALFWSAISNAAHSPGAKTGSPADGLNCTKCHTGTPQNVSNWITSNIPASGYAPGQTYMITLTGTHNGVQRFGFEFTAEDANNAKIGTFTIVNSTQTKFTNMMEAVTHTGNGLAPSNDSKSWSFDWTAPVAGSGDVTFYAALNAANGNMGTSGDVIYLTNQMVSENLNVSIAENESENSFKVFPIPAHDFINIEYQGLDGYEISILDLSGKQLMHHQAQSQGVQSRIDISSLPKGYYIIQLQNGSDVRTKRFVKQ